MCCDCRAGGAGRRIGKSLIRGGGVRGEGRRNPYLWVRGNGDHTNLTATVREPSHRGVPSIMVLPPSQPSVGSHPFVEAAHTRLALPMDDVKAGRFDIAFAPEVSRAPMPRPNRAGARTQARISKTACGPGFENAHDDLGGSCGSQDDVDMVRADVDSEERPASMLADISNGRSHALTLAVAELRRWFTHVTADALFPVEARGPEQRFVCRARRGVTAGVPWEPAAAGSKCKEVGERLCHGSSLAVRPQPGGWHAAGTRLPHGRR